MSPSQGHKLVQIMYNILKPEGYAFIQVHTVSREECIVDAFIDQKSNKSLNPGYLILDRFVFREVDLETNQQRNCGMKTIKAHPTNNYDWLPGEEKPGFYDEGENEIKWQLHETLPTKQVYRRKCHAVMHYFDIETLSEYFKDNGFEVEDVFYLDDQGHKVERHISTDDMKRNIYALGLIARKQSMSSDD